MAKYLEIQKKPRKRQLKRVLGTTRKFNIRNGTESNLANKLKFYGKRYYANSTFKYNSRF